MGHVTKMGSINSQKIDFTGVEVLKGQRHIPSKKLTEVTPGIERHTQSKTGLQIGGCRCRYVKERLNKRLDY